MSLRALAKDLGATELIAPVTRRIDGYEHVSVFVIDPAIGEKLRATHYVFDSVPVIADNMVARRVVKDLEASGALH